jgi:hypothetical protein
MNKTKIKYFAIALILLCCLIGAASAADDVSTDIVDASADDAVDSISESSYEVLEEEDNGNEVLSGNPATASTWTQLHDACESTSDQEITLSDNITIGTNDISINNNAVIIGNENVYITGNANGRIPFQCGNLALDITFENVTFKDISSTMLIKVQNSGVTTLKGCTFINVNASNSGQNSVIYNNNGIMNIENCTFENCNAAFGAITNHKAGSTNGVTLNVYNSTFENNYGNAPGVINNCGQMTVYYSVFNNNSANQWGGAIHTHSGATSTIRNSTFNGNVAGWNGGALYAYGTLKVYDSNFTNNNCTTNNGGGAIGASNYFFTNYEVYVKNCRFVDNNNLCYLFDENSTETLGRGGAISVLNGGKLTVLGSTFIHNGAKIGQAICGYNTNYYSNISTGYYNLYIANNVFINHTITTNDTVYYVGGCTLTGNTFTNSPQTIGTAGNLIQSSDIVSNPTLRGFEKNILGIYENDVLSDNSINLYVNASSGKTFMNDEEFEPYEDANALSWETAPSIGMFSENELFQMLIMAYYYDSYNINLADGVYSCMMSIGANVNYIGYGDNVVFKIDDVSYGNMPNPANITFTNIIFEDSTLTFDDFNFGFNNCTFKNCTIEFAKVKSSKTYAEDENVIISTAVLSDCKFVNSTSDQIINIHKYELVTIDNCTFDNVVSDSVILITSNYTDSNDKKDGVTVNNLNIINSDVKGILKVEKDSLSRLSSDNLNHDFANVQETLVDGDYTYLVVPVTATTMTVNVADIKEGEDFNIEVTLSDNLTADVSVVINNQEYKVSVVNGTGSLKVTDKLAANTYDVVANYAGEYPYGASVANTSFKVEKVIVGTKLAAPKVTATYNVAKKLVITLTDKNGKALANKKVSVKVGSISKTLTTDKNGKVSLNVATLVPKTYTATVKFAGDSDYSASTVSPKVVVKKAKVKLAAKAKTFKVKVKTKKYIVTLKNNKGKVMKKVKLTLKVGKKTYKATTNAKGKATFKITKLTKKGKYTATVKFAGNKYYNALSKKVKITVKK